jgi:DNA-binding NarL/FixJ family response regulator
VRGKIPSKGALRVVIAEDSGLMREGLARPLADAGLDVVAKVGDGPGLIAAVEKQCPDVAVVDVRMPPRLPRRGPQGGHRALSPRTRPHRAGALALRRGALRRRAARAGAAGIGYLLKDRVADVSEFVAAVREVASGGTVLDPEVVSQPLSRRRRDQRLTALTPRERDVLSLMAEGRSNHAIARALYVTEGAVCPSNAHRRAPGCHPQELGSDLHSAHLRRPQALVLALRNSPR